MHLLPRYAQTWRDSRFTTCPTQTKYHDFFRTRRSFWALLSPTRPSRARVAGTFLRRRRCDRRRRNSLVNAGATRSAAPCGVVAAANITGTVVAPARRGKEAPPPRLPLPPPPSNCRGPPALPARRLQSHTPLRLDSGDRVRAAAARDAAPSLTLVPSPPRPFRPAEAARPPPLGARHRPMRPSPRAVVAATSSGT